MQTFLADTELKALIELLDDPDEMVYQNVSERLVSFGKHVIPRLEGQWEEVAQRGVQSRIEEIIHQIEFEVCQLALTDWRKGTTENLFEGELASSMFQYPDQQVTEMVSKLELLRKDIWLELNDNLTSLEKVRVINHILYDVHGFDAHIKYHKTDQSGFLKNVFETHKGSPTAMAILYKIIADKLELPIVGINLPDHFILGYKDIYNHTDQDLLFYINPFSKGAVFGKSELERYIEKMQIEMDVDDLNPISNVQIIERKLNDLKACYKKQGKYRKLTEVDQLLTIL
ncbi:MAG: transglutaminase-like domain-containing protein [Flavobacteriales bacterium]